MNANRSARWVATRWGRRNVLLLLCLFAYTLRLFHLDAQSLWYDEGFSVWLAAQSLDQIIARTAADIHPPLYYVLLHLWIALVGQSEFALRFLSLMAGVLMVPAFFAFARRLLDETTAWIATLLAALSPMYIWYAQEARMYAWLTLLTLLSSYFFWRWLERATWRRWLAFTLCNLCAVYLHFYGFFIIAFQLAYFFVWWVRQETRWGILGAGLGSALLVAAAYLPWARYAAARFDADQSYFEGTLSLAEVLRKTFVMFSTGHSMLEGDALPIALLFVLLAAFGLFVMGRLRRDALTAQDENPFRRALTVGAAARLYLLLYLVVPFVLLYFISYARPKFHPRYLLLASPPFLIMLAAAMTVLLLAFWRSASARRRYLALVLASGMGIFVLATSLSADNNLYFDPRFSKDDFRAVVNTIKANRASGEPTLLVSGHMFPIYAYYDPSAQWIPLPDEPTLSTQRVLGYNVANDLNRYLRDASGAWLVLWQDDVVDPSGFVKTILDTQAKPLPQPQSFYGVRLLHYQIPRGTVFSDKPQIQQPLYVNYGGQIELLGYNLPATPSPADKGLNLTLYWRALADLKKDYSVALRVLDADGHLVGKLDARPGNYNYPTTRWKNGDVLFGNFSIPLALATPPGNYQVDVTVYAADAPEGLDVLDEAANPKGKFTTLQSIPIERAAAQPPIEKLKPTHVLRFNFGNAIEMLGFDMDRDRAEPGEGINLSIYWRALSSPKDDYRIAFQSQRGASVDEIPALDSLMALAPTYPTSQWRQGEVIRGQYTFYIPTDTLAGDRALRLVVLDRNNKPLAAAISLGDLHVEPSSRLFRPPPVRIVDITRFGGSIQLYGYDVSPTPTLRTTVSGTTTVSAGDVLRVTLYWRALQRLRTSYTVFVQMRQEGKPPLTQRDSIPVNGARPTTSWVPGEYITDSYDLFVPRSAAPGTYVLEVGLYDARTGERLPLQISQPIPNTSSAERLGVVVVVR